MFESKEMLKKAIKSTKNLTMIGVCQNNNDNKTQGFTERASNGRVRAI